jgi:fatty acid desaturase
MWRQASGGTSTLVEGQTNGTAPKANEPPWIRPWWQPSEGKGGAFFYIVMILALALVGLTSFPLPGWRVLAVALAVAEIGGVGTSVCYHRCLAHRSLRLNRVVENVLIFFTIFNASGAPLTWVARHRNHHAKADTVEDISSPRHAVSGGRTSDGFIRRQAQRFVAGALIWTNSGIGFGGRFKFLSSYFQSSRGWQWAGKGSFGLEPSAWSMCCTYKCSSIVCST